MPDGRNGWKMKRFHRQQFSFPDPEAFAGMNYIILPVFCHDVKSLLKSGKLAAVPRVFRFSFHDFTAGSDALI
ncbi:MAG: hypothetical protein IKO13_02690 [Oscillospiraceae bacterium]|nr:hypothetical protein [Oscillospiraceae bacterium]